MLKTMAISSIYSQIRSLAFSLSFWFPTNLNSVSELLIFSFLKKMWQQKHKQNSEKLKKKSLKVLFSLSVTFWQLQQNTVELQGSIGASTDLRLIFAARISVTVKFFCFHSVAAHRAKICSSVPALLWVLCKLRGCFS